MLPFYGLSVIFVHCAQTAEDIDTTSFTYNKARVLTSYRKETLKPLQQGQK